ncbi:hypothetical protein Rxyl_2764 [Rubrobacter xylanophilus DSM 9941]|uniref:Cyclodeaminase/cyclohydrolase domain-containing protein n=1 Tax=Rubrobacter xylanophilus (strain DSM 9941 / JCM 11954 / NBRC 16129 / PRD-1) TaxID=266117 RepID=Q1ASF0_RUBXD|nr:hypothetical protein [Rubrobacter xylanophilus]ABG05678.1 hypothetical protein Rxyl_2764 [Rubrobacter xylanophilus DSM 9941]
MEQDATRKALLSSGASAAEGLLRACSSGDGPQRLQMVRDLAQDLKRQLEALSSLPRAEASSDALAEAALRCGDVATLAACNAGALPPEGRDLALEAARRAREVTAGVLAGLEREGEAPENALRDARSADWRASLALRQLGERA